jgi:Ca2+/Na+ antiporter
MKPDPSPVEDQLAAIARELRVTRCLLIFVALCAGLPLFAPRLAAWIAAQCDMVWTRLSPHIVPAAGVVVSLLAVFFCAAYVVGRIKSPSSRVTARKSP